MTDQQLAYVLRHAKCKDQELIMQAVHELQEFFKDDNWEDWDCINYTHDDSTQTNCVDAYCLGWEKGQKHLLNFIA